MMRRSGAVILCLLLVGGAVTAGLAWYLLVVRLPDPRTANRAGLGRWLVLRDLSAEPRDVQLALVDRLQGELMAGFAGDGGVPLSPAYRRQLAENAEFLQHVWFEHRSQQYAKCGPDEQMPFLERQIDAIASWSALPISTDDDAAGSDAAPGDPAVQFFTKLEGWIDEAAGETRTQMITAVQDGVVCWLATRDLGEQPRSVRLELALRIVRQLNAGMRLDEILIDLTPPQREKLFANGELLLEAWLHDQARVYAELPAEQRMAYLDARLEEVYKWGVLEVLAPASDSTGGKTASPAITQMAGLLRLVTLTGQWIERADPEERPRLERLVADVKAQLWRQQFPRK